MLACWRIRPLESGKHRIRGDHRRRGRLAALSDSYFALVPDRHWCVVADRRVYDAHLNGRPIWEQLARGHSPWAFRRRNHVWSHIHSVSDHAISSEAISTRCPSGGGERNRIEFDQSGYRVESDLGKGEVKWAAIVEVIETPSSFFLKIAAHMAIVAPKRGFNPGQLHEFRALVQAAGKGPKAAGFAGRWS